MPKNKNNWDFGPTPSVGAPQPAWRQITDGVTTSGSTTLSSSATNGEFSAGDVGASVSDPTADRALGVPVSPTH